MRHDLGAPECLQVRCPQPAGGRAPLLPLAAALLCAAALAAAEDPPLPYLEEDPDRVWPEMTLEELIESLPHPTQDVVDPPNFIRFYSGNFFWEHGTERSRVRIACDRIIIHWRMGEAEAVEPGERPRPRFYFFAEGNVRVELPHQEISIEAESFFYDHVTSLAVARNARLVTRVSLLQGVADALEARDLRLLSRHHRAAGLHLLQVVISGEVLRTRDFKRFEGTGISVSPCEYEVPHLGLAAEKVAAAPAGEEDQRREYTFDLERARFELLGHTVLPLPFTYWDTRWHGYLPIRSFPRLGSSSKFGTHAGADWNLNFFLRQLPQEEPIRWLTEETRLDFETTYMSRRGFGYGPKGAWGRRREVFFPWQLQLEDWNHYGEGRYFRIHDTGVDRVTRRPPPDPDRFWGAVHHRQSVPYLGLVDVEYSRLSDAAFLPEYFEAIAKQEKEQESLVYARRNFGDNLALTGLYKYRVNDFDAELERIPEGKLLLLQQPIFETGLYTDLIGQAANLRVRPPAASGLDSQRFGRADLLNEWAFPLDFHPYLETRPFTVLRYTGYERLADPARGAEDRSSFGAGITLSQAWSRPFPIAPDCLLNRWFGIEDLKHVVVPKVTYFNLFANDLRPEETLQVDDVDVVALEESVSLSLRQALIQRRQVPGGGRRIRPFLGGRELELFAAEYVTRPVLDSEVSLVHFPRPHRDNRGDPLSFLILDNTFFPSPSLALRAWLALDPNRDFRPERVDGSIRIDWIPGAFSTTIGDRLAASSPRLPEGRHFLYGIVSLALSEKWQTQVYWSRDLVSGRDLEYTFSLRRIFHRFALTFEYGVDFGEDRNESFTVNFVPMDIAGTPREFRSRW
jgi:hypothetical protein